MYQRVECVNQSKIVHIKEYLTELEKSGTVDDEWNGFKCYCWKNFKHRNQIVTEDGYKFVAFKSTAGTPKSVGKVDYGLVPPVGEDWSYNPTYAIHDDAIVFVTDKGVAIIFKLNDGIVVTPSEYLPKNTLDENLETAMNTSDSSRGMKIIAIQNLTVKMFCEWIDSLPRGDKWYALDSLAETNNMMLKTLTKYVEEAQE